jgi:FkbM family methyltransferase
MTEAKLKDGTKVFCLRRQEAVVLDSHVDGYLQHGIDIEENDIIFDVGANIGMFGLRAFQRYKSIRVFAFEPIPSIHEVLAANAVRFGGKAYHALNCGLSDKAGELNFTYFPNAPALSTAHVEDWDRNPQEFRKAVAGALRTAPMWYARWIPSFMSGFIAKRLRANAQQVRCPLRTVSEVMDEYNLPRIDLLKIDCEGAELAVLQGIRAEHWAVVRKVVIEVHDIDNRREIIKNMLTNHGFAHIVEEQEAGFEQTTMINIFAHR